MEIASRSTTTAVVFSVLFPKDDVKRHEGESEDTIHSKNFGAYILGI